MESSGRFIKVLNMVLNVHINYKAYKGRGEGGCDNRGVYVRSEKLVCARAAAERAANSSCN